MNINKRKGFFEVDGILDLNVINNLYKEILTSYQKESADKKFGGTISGHLNCQPGSSTIALIHNIQDTNLFNEIADYFSINLSDYNISIGANINLPGSHFQHMHMDSNFFDQLYILNIPLVDTSKENGSISIVPDSHLKPYSYIQYLVKRLYKKRIRLNQEAGSCLVRTSNLWHRGTPNKTKNIRPMINLVFSMNKDKNNKDYLISNLDNHPDLKGPIRFTNNWYTTTRLGRLWEILTVKAPFIHAVKRIIMSVIRPIGTST
ncbi:MAG: hypothetical protein CMD46_00930 [Gammaproteobacteria bacterium]|nr:hypothetical protein [Gammaproteobacteria bacterium]|tara:strand:- start:15167 stop:15952 length:786 start_codon:yes stop_codon:yes gene_type:complete